MFLILSTFYPLLTRLLHLFGNNLSSFGLVHVTYHPLHLVFYCDVTLTQSCFLLPIIKKVVDISTT
jgi:hypothetical protein